VHAQDTSKPKIEDEYIKVKKAEVAQQKTPEFTVGNVTQKRMKPKDWLEIEFELDITKPKEAKGEVRYLDDVQIKYYVYLDAVAKEKARVLTADISYINAPVGETMHSVVYLSNASVTNLTGATTVDRGAVKFFGAEVSAGGKVVGWFSNNGSAWWKSPKAPPTEPGRLQPKAKTPFAPLWFDYYLEEKATP
jgi:hypothetical protein